MDHLNGMGKPQELEYENLKFVILMALRKSATSLQDGALFSLLLTSISRPRNLILIFK